MGTSLHGSSHVKRWLDSLETVLHARAAVAGLIEHNPTTGMAREFFVSEILQAFLPQAAHIGQGKIVHSDERLSKQIDIVVYDGRCPQFRVDNRSSLYLAEGVIAAIEIKSVVDKQELLNLLENCRSATPIRIQVVDDHVDAAQIFAEKRGIDIQHALRIRGQMAMPKTFGFAYRSSLTPESLIRAYFERLSEISSSDLGIPEFPRVVVAGDLVAIVADHNAVFEFTERDLDAVRSIGGAHVECVAACWKTKHRFGMLGSTIALAAIDRLGPSHAAADARYALENYLPLNLYSQEQREMPAAFLWLAFEDASKKRATKPIIGLRNSGRAQLDVCL